LNVETRTYRRLLRASRLFERVFAELDRRKTPYVKINAAHHHYDPSPNGHEKFALVFNRMSPSAWNRGRADSIFTP